MNTDVKLLQRLRYIHGRMQDPKHWTVLGICSLINNGELTVRFSQIAKLWDKYSGYEQYPVPSVKRITPEDSFNIYSKSGMWDRRHSEYAKLRWGLLEFAIDYLEEGMNNEHGKDTSVGTQERSRENAGTRQLGRDWDLF